MFHAARAVILVVQSYSITKCLKSQRIVGEEHVFINLKAEIRLGFRIMSDRSACPEAVLLVWVSRSDPSAWMLKFCSSSSFLNNADQHAILSHEFVTSGFAALQTLASMPNLSC